MGPQGVMVDEVIDAALSYAAQYLVEATRAHCHVRQRSTARGDEDDQGGHMGIRMPDAHREWDVMITNRTPSNPPPGRYLVRVGYFVGRAIGASNFVPF
jgi:hypothetical protein